MIAQYVDKLVRIFSAAPDKHAAHTVSRSVLEEIADDPTFLREALIRRIRAGDGLGSPNYPVLVLPIASNPYFDLMLNCWIPLPDRSTDVSTKAIHHHGTMLLTTITTFGPGYEHWTFTRPKVTDPERELFASDVISHGDHPRGHVDFVDSYTAHVPLFPASLSITAALWSTRSASDWRDRVKRVQVLSRRSAPLRRLATAFGLRRALALKNIEYFDFYPSEEGLVGMKNRTEFPHGPKADFAHSLFNIVQHTENEALLPHLEEAAAKQPPDDRVLIDQLLSNLRNGTAIEGRLSEGHYGVPFANFSRAAIERAVIRRPDLPSL